MNPARDMPISTRDAGIFRLRSADVKRSGWFLGKCRIFAMICLEIKRQRGGVVLSGIGLCKVSRLPRRTLSDFLQLIRCPAKCLKN